MTGPAIAALGAYAPRLRVAAETVEDAWGRFGAAGIDETAVPDADEDSLTMAYEAAVRALQAADADGTDLDRLAFATTRPPMAEADLTARLASMLGAPESLATATLTGSTRAGGQALADALDADMADGGLALVVASDCPRGAPESDLEHAAGAGAGAVLLADAGPGSVLDHASHVASYPGTRFREADATDTTSLGITPYERAAYRETLDGAVAALDSDVGAVDAAAIQAPDGALPYRVRDALGVSADAIDAATTVDSLGDTGAASVFLGAAEAVASGAEEVLLVAYGGGGGADAFLLDAAGVPVRRSVAGDVDLTYPAYLRRRGEITPAEPEGGGAYVSVPSWQRTTPQRHRLVAGRCPACASLHFPPDGACVACGTRPDSYDPVPLPGSGTIEAVTTIAQGGAPPEFVEQQARSGPFVSAVVAFEGPRENDRVSVPVQVQVGDGETPAVGDRVSTTVRRIYEQEGVVRYGIKAVLEAVGR